MVFHAGICIQVYLGHDFDILGGSRDVTHQARNHLIPQVQILIGTSL